MQRQWITTLSLPSKDLEELIMKDDRLARNLGNKINTALFELESRIAGQIAFTAVPSPAVGRLLEHMSSDQRPHLVLPFEIEREDEGSTIEHPRWLRDILLRAGSINVQPGRGHTAADWDDCYTWLDSISEIQIRLMDSEGGPTGSPSVEISAEEENALFFGFPGNEPLWDLTFDETVREIFGDAPATGNLEDIQKQAGLIADKAAPRFRFFQTGSLLLNITPSLILALGAAFSWADSTVNFWKFSAAGAAALTALGLRSQYLRNRWLITRSATESCRSLGASGKILDPLFPPAVRFLPKTAAFSRSLSLELQAEHGRDLSKSRLQKAKEAYLETRIDGQISYYNGQAVQNQSKRRLVRLVFFSAIALAFISTLISFTYDQWLAPWINPEFNQHWISGFSTFAFPAVAAAAIGYLGLSDSIRRANHFQHMVSELRHQRAALAKLRSHASIKEAIRDTEAVLLGEVGDWIRQRDYWIPQLDAEKSPRNSASPL